jgi:hypothetical protein
MRFIINDVTYEAASLERITGRDAIALTRQVGYGVQTLAKRLESWSRLSQLEDLLEDPDNLTALLAFVWLSRRAAGESLTFDEACDVEILSIRMQLDAGDAVEEPAEDPTSAPTDSVEDSDAGA